MRYLDRARMRFAAEKVGEVPEREREGYRSRVRSAPTLVRQCGILQAMSVWQAADGAAGRMSNHVREWFSHRHNNLIRVEANERLDAVELSKLTLVDLEARAILAWLKRLSEAQLGSKEDADGGEEE